MHVLALIVFGSVLATTASFGPRNYLHPRRGAQCGNLKGYSAASKFLAVFALAYSKINEIAYFWMILSQEVSD